MKRTVINVLMLLLILPIVFSCNKNTIQKVVEKNSKAEITEPEEEFNIKNIYGDWKLIKQNLESNYASFVGDRDVFVAFNGNKNIVTNYFIDTVSQDTTILEYGFTINDRKINVYDLNSQQPITLMYVDSLKRKNMTVTVNYDKMGQQFNLKYSKFNK